ncbi:MAG: RNA methyltransferase [Bacteroidales bacterium]|nr:RNA methyltransferase [Bacteroidales bacterium]
MTTKELIAELKNYVGDDRAALLERRLKDRTRYITIVLENVFHEQNVSAVIRTCECLGIQDIHIIGSWKKSNVFETIDRGAAKWLNIYHYTSDEDNTRTCLDRLRKEGYRLVATTPHLPDELPPMPGFGASYSLTRTQCELYDFDVCKGRFAIIIGSERRGISQTVANEADEAIRIPMRGFTESFNLSATTAIIAAHLRHEIEQKIGNIGLSEEECDETLVEWLKASIRNIDGIMKRINQE